VANPNGFPSGAGTSTNNDALTQRPQANLDRTPPSPALGRPEPLRGGFRNLAPPVSLGSDQPQANRDVMTGILQTLEGVDKDLALVAKAMPDQAAEIDRILDAVRLVSGKLLTEGIVATDETAPGPAFPGGGIGRGPR
jgi:hypothetical protein